MTEEQVVEIILKVSKRVAHKYTFGAYDEDDIIQEGFLIGMDGLERYDESRPLENFLQVHISNRLYNLRRDEHYDTSSKEEIKKVSDKKRLLLEPININNVKDYNEDSMMYYDNVGS